MSKKEPLVTKNSVLETILGLKADAKQDTLRGIRDKLGGGSLSTIHAMRLEIRTESPEIPPSIETKLGPYMNAGAELVRRTVKELNAVHQSQIETLQNDCDAIVEQLSKAEAEALELAARIEELEAKLIERDAAKKMDSETIARLNRVAEQTSSEMIKRSIREEDYKEAKAEATEAREKAAKLEGRLLELERRLAETEQPRKEPSVKKNKA